MILMGLIQILCGVFKLGKFIRMVPHPVMLGFVNGLAIIIFKAQLSQFTVHGQLLATQPLVIMCGLIGLTIFWGRLYSLMNIHRMNEKSGAKRLPSLDIGYSLLDIGCSERYGALSVGRPYPGKLRESNERVRATTYFTASIWLLDNRPSQSYFTTVGSAGHMLPLC